MAESQHWSQTGMRKWDSSDGTSTQNRPFRKFQNWILKHQFMRMHMQTVLTNKQNHHTSWHEQAIASPQIPEPVSSMLPDRFCSKNTKKWIETEETNVSALRICFPTLEIQNKGDRSADDNVSNQVWQNAKLLRLCWINGFTVRLVKTCCSQCVATCCYVMEPFKMYQNVIQHGILIGFWHCTSTKWIPPEDQRRLSDESVEVWHIETFTSLECFSVKLFQWRSVWPQRCNGAMFCCLPLQSEVPCSLRCEIVQTYGGEIHWLRFMSQICGKYVP